MRGRARLEAARRRAARSSLAGAAAVLAVGCSFDFDSLCRQGEVCGEISVTPPATREPSLGQGPTCHVYRARCGDDDANQFCAFRITGDGVDAPPECRSSFGSSSDGRSCMDASFCSLGFTCFRPDAATSGTCVDLCQTLADCEGVSRTCDRSAPIATLDGVPVFRCVDTQR